MLKSQLDLIAYVARAIEEAGGIPDLSSLTGDLRQEYDDQKRAKEQEVRLEMEPDRQEFHDQAR